MPSVHASVSIPQLACACVCHNVCRLLKVICMEYRKLMVKGNKDSEECVSVGYTQGKRFTQLMNITGTKLAY